jgi:hypothetical protein
LAHKTKIGGTAYEIGSGKVLVGGTGYSIDKGRTKVDGTGYDIAFGTQIGSLEIGASVFLNVGGNPTEFLVINQGAPSSRYRNADGTWLLMKDIYERRNWGSTTNDYENSGIHAYLNGDFLGLFDSEIQSAIMQVKVPYWKGDSVNGALSYNTNGLQTKIFLLSGYEAGWTKSYSSTYAEEGACVSYFSGTATQDEKRIAYYNGTAASWWTRSPVVGYAATNNTIHTVHYSNGGNSSTYPENDGGYYTCGLRPALVLPKTTVIG